MSNVLVTGCSGMVGSVLKHKLTAQGHTVWALSRHPMNDYGHTPLTGDILEPNLGVLATPREGFVACYHLAAVMRLGEDTDGTIWKTNVEGTRNVLDFCSRYEIPHLYFCSTAYTTGRNTYERSKRLCELMVGKSDIPHKTIFKPSIIMPAEDITKEQHFMQYVRLLVSFHVRAENVRRKVESTLRLPPIAPVFRIAGKSEAKVNLVSLEAVASAMGSIKSDGTYWLTNPYPPTLHDICEWVGESINVILEPSMDFKAMPLEVMFQRMTRAFSPYLEGNDEMPSDIPPCAIDKKYIQGIVKTILKS